MVDNKILQAQLNNEIPVPGKTGLDWYLYAYFLDLYKQGNFLEIGVGDGGSLVTMLAYSTSVTAIDSWKFGWYKERLIDCLGEYATTIKFIDKDTRDINPNELETYQFIHLDANKEYHRVQEDLALADKLSDGVICVDDYMNSMWPEVTWAVDDFVRDNTYKKILIGNHQIFLARRDQNLRKIIMEFPVVLRDNCVHLTYGAIPLACEKFCKASSMIHTWHKEAWPYE